MADTKVLLTGLAFGESPRWHEGKLWFSDFYRRGVYTVDLDGVEERVLDVENQPSGLGWLPDGRLLVVSMVDRLLLRREADGTVVVHADLADLASYHANDLLVDGAGRAYVSNFGYDLHEDMAEREVPEILADQSAGQAVLVRVDPDGTAVAAADDLRFPNGMALLDGGRTLVVAQTLRLELTAFDAADDGALSNRRVWASLMSRLAAPDGICAGADNTVWVANALGPQVLQVAEGGDVVRTVTTNQLCYACAVGGPDGDVLFAMTAPSSEPKIVNTGDLLATIETASIG